MTSKLIKVSLYASEIAAIVGKNPYKTVVDSFIIVWERVYPEDYKKIASLCKYKSDKEKAEEILQRKDIKEKVDIDSLKVKGDIGDSKKLYQDTVSKLEDFDIEESDKRNVRNYISGKINTSFGTKHEDSAVSSIKGASKPTKRYELDMKTWILSGKIDAVVKDGRIIEIKHRMKKFMNNEYDPIQCLCYIFLTGADECELKEVLRISKDKIENRSTIIKKDDELWAEIIEECNIFVDKLNKFVTKSKDSLRIRYLTSSEIARENIYDSL